MKEIDKIVDNTIDDICLHISDEVTKGILNDFGFQIKNEINKLLEEKIELISKEIEDVIKSSKDYKPNDDVVNLILHSVKIYCKGAIIKHLKDDD